MLNLKPSEPEEPAKVKPERKSIASRTYAIYRQSLEAQGHSALPWEGLEADYQDAWASAAEAMQPEPEPEKWVPKFCPGCGESMQEIIMSKNLIKR
jgi:hypothetical protein